MRQLIAGNWKMNGMRADAMALAGAIRAGAEGVGCDLVLCPPATVLAAVADVLQGSSIGTGGQDCHVKGNGAHTGDISPAMLRDAGAAWVIVGHSERREAYAESNALIRDKAVAAMAAGLLPIICVGETEQQRMAGAAETVVAAQVDGSVPAGFTGVIAYEPIWAIGTGRVAEPADIARHAPVHPGSVGRHARRERAGGPDPLWRVGQARRGGGRSGAARRGRRAGRRREFGRGRLPGHRAVQL